MSNEITKEEFDNLVYASGWVAPFDETQVQLDGSFGVKELEAIVYAMKEHPEWLRQEEQA